MLADLKGSYLLLALLSKTTYTCGAEVEQSLTCRLSPNYKDILTIIKTPNYKGYIWFVSGIFVDLSIPCLVTSTDGDLVLDEINSANMTGCSSYQERDWKGYYIAFYLVARIACITCDATFKKFLSESFKLFIVLRCVRALRKIRF